MHRHTPAIFRDPIDGRPRALVRVLVPVLCTMSLMVALDLLVVQPVHDTPLGYLVAAAGRFGIALGVVALTARWLDRRRLRDYGLGLGRRSLGDLCLGAAVGLAMFGLSAGLGVAGGWLQVQEVLSTPAIGGLWTILALATIRLAAVSFWEELVFRGVLIKNSAEALGERRSPLRAVVGATLISTAIFAVIHVPQNLGAEAPLWRMALVWVSMGVLLALPYVLTGRLALSLGLHLTINLALQHVFVIWGESASASATVLRFEVQEGAEAIAGVGGWLQIGTIALGYLAVLGWIRVRYGRLGIHASVTRRPTERPAVRERVGEAT